MELLKAGDHIKLKAPSRSGWHGFGHVIKDEIEGLPIIFFAKLDRPRDDYTFAHRNQVKKAD